MIYNRVLNVFECFAGIGSQAKALANIEANYKIVGISEIEPLKEKVYAAINGNVKNYGDIQTLKVEDIKENINLFTYSFPCQDISINGKMKGIKEGSRSSLIYDTKKIIEAKKPKFLVMENNPPLLTTFKEDFKNWCSYLESLGYKNSYKIINSVNYGTPQKRKRVFMISILNSKEHFNFPIPNYKEVFTEDILEEEPQAAGPGIGHMGLDGGQFQCLQEGVDFLSAAL